MLISPLTMKPVVAQQRRRMSLEKMQRFMEFEQILRECGWQLVCEHCTKIHGPGKDGVRGENDVRSNELRVECSCTAYVFDAQRA